MGFLDVIKKLNTEECGLKCLDDNDIRVIHKIYVDMIVELDSICKEYGIKWALCGGNAIGALRHGGFIPWDDDLDIVMMRRDYEALKRAFSSRKDDIFELKKPGDKGYIFHFPRIYNNEVVMKGLQSTDDCEMGLNIDIFVVENIPDNKVLRIMHGGLCTLMLTIDAAVRMRRCSKTIEKYAMYDEELRKSLRVRKMIGLIFGFFSLETWASLSEKVFSMCRNHKSKNVAIPTGRKHYFGEIYKREDMCEVEVIEYEGINAYVPKGVNNYLTSLFGPDYMTPPKKGKEERHPYVEVDLSKRKRFGGDGS